MKKTIGIKPGDITESVFSVITSQWQTASIIACQVVLPPDAVSRRTWNRRLTQGNGRDAGSRSDLIHQRLKVLVAKGAVEKRKINKHLNEYRLAQPADAKN